jgi:hypothetical protein
VKASCDGWPRSRRASSRRMDGSGVPDRATGGDHEDRPRSAQLGISSSSASRVDVVTACDRCQPSRARPISSQVSAARQRSSQEDQRPPDEFRRHEQDRAKPTLARTAAIVGRAPAIVEVMARVMGGRASPDGATQFVHSMVSAERQAAHERRIRRPEHQVRSSDNA